MIDWDEFEPYITEREMRCPHCDDAAMDVGFLRDLLMVRLEFNRPMIFTSAKRCPDYNAQISFTGSRSGPHTLGVAVDIKCVYQDADALVRLLYKHGFYGVGVRQHGPADRRFVHADKDPRRHAIWTYDAPALKVNGRDV